MVNVVTYSGTPREMEEAALKDCKEYLGDEWDRVVRELRNYWHHSEDRVTKRYKAVRFALAMQVGIQGKYPVRAMVREAMKEPRVILKSVSK